MSSITATDARKNFFNLIAKVNEDCAPITITNSRGSNAVLVGEDEWSAIEETLYLISYPNVTKAIQEGMKTAVEDCVDESDLDW